MRKIIKAAMGYRNISLPKETVAVVTGASGDIGIAISRSLHEAGANVVMASRDTEKLEAAAGKIAEDKSRILTVTTDVTNISQIDRLMKSCMKAFGRIDVLITAAGIQIRKPALEFSPGEWESVLKTNLSGTFYSCQRAAKYMIKQNKGKIVLISSLTAEIGIPDMVAYVASRGAIRQMTKALAVEWARYGINVNCIGPGRMQTAMTNELFADEKVKNSFLQLIPMGRVGRPEDLAGLVLFLSSESSDYITGQSVYVDGGWLAAGGNTLR